MLSFSDGRTRLKKSVERFYDRIGLELTSHQRKLLENIDYQIESWSSELSVIVINDASTETKGDLKFDYKNIKKKKENL